MFLPRVMAAPTERRKGDSVMLWLLRFHPKFIASIARTYTSEIALPTVNLETDVADENRVRMRKSWEREICLMLWSILVLAFGRTETNTIICPHCFGGFKFNCTFWWVDRNSGPLKILKRLSRSGCCSFEGKWEFGCFCKLKWIMVWIFIILGIINYRYIKYFIRYISYIWR